MDTKKVYNAVQEILGTNYGEVQCHEETMRLAAEALTKQLPKKVEHRKGLKNFKNEVYAIRGNCPICGSEGLLSSNTDYCNCCGQKLDWN